MSDQERQEGGRYHETDEAEVEGHLSKRAQATDQPADDDTDEPEVEGHALRALDKPNEGKNSR